jgi:hypothetical protein
VSAAVLREAAALMRERAEKTETSGTWETGNRYQRQDDWLRPVYDDDGTVCEIHEGNADQAPESCEQLADHIASWHPAVALAVADLLIVVAAEFEHGGHDETWGPYEAADELAANYLGDSP